MKKLLDKAEEEKEELRGKVGVAQISFLKKAKAKAAVTAVHRYSNFRGDRCGDPPPTHTGSVHFLGLSYGHRIGSGGSMSPPEMTSKFLTVF